MIRDIRVELRGSYELVGINLSHATVPLDAEIQGVKRWVGNVTNFRIEPPRILIFDFEEANEFGIMFASDFRANRVRFCAKFQEANLLLSRSLGEIVPKDEVVKGNILLDVEGQLTLVELPTTACAKCGKVFPVCDAYRSTRDADRLICPGCFEAGKAAGTIREGESSGQNPFEERTAAQNRS